MRAYRFETKCEVLGIAVKTMADPGELGDGIGRVVLADGRS
jgi:hypothetical protein